MKFLHIDKCTFLLSVSQELIDLIQGYTDMKESIDQLNGTDILTIDVNGNLYTADISTLLFTTNISCPEGTVNDELLCGKPIEDQPFIKCIKCFEI